MTRLAFLLGAAALLLMVPAFRPSLQAQGTPPAHPTRTPKACHICDEAEAAPANRPVVAAAATADLPLAQFGPVVRAALFWMDTCPHCHEVIEEVLPPLQRRYGPQLDIRLVEIRSQEEFERLYPVAACYGIPQEYFGVPFLIIGEHALLGSDRIAAELPGLVERYLLAGGVDLPNSPCLMAVLRTADINLCRPDDEACAEEVLATVAQPSGFELAIAVLVGMVGVLALGGVMAVREWQAPPRPRTAPRFSWTAWAFPLLALVGLALAGYLAYVEMCDVPAVCGPVGDCNAVQNGPYALFLGFLPVGLLGVLGYITILAVWVVGRFGRGGWSRWAWPILLGLTLFGTLFSLYLTFLEPFVIRAVCTWCLTSAVVMTTLFLLTIRPAVRALRESWRRP